MVSGNLDMHCSFWRSKVYVTTHHLLLLLIPYRKETLSWAGWGGVVDSPSRPPLGAAASPVYVYLLLKLLQF